MCGKMQMENWKGKFGEEYTDRNYMAPDEYDKLCLSRIGISRTKQIEDFLSGLRLNCILEIGCNVANQLLLLQKELFKECDYYGVEINQYAIEKSKYIVKRMGIKIVQASALDIPFKDAYFDLVFTSGVLIHIPPKNINKALDEIYRCSRKYIWGLEYYSKGYVEVDYRGCNDLLWKTDFLNLYLNRFPELKLIKEIKYHYLQDKKLVDQVFLLKKGD